MLPFPTILLRLGVALLLGALVGFERESRDQDAGLRTNSLVALGTALFTIISATAFQDLLDRPHTQVDPTRIASYVVAGIGFLAGGSIFISHNTQKVKGLTTAAAVWMVAAIGMACGAGLLIEAVTGTVLAMLVLVGFRYLEAYFWPHSHSRPQVVVIETEYDARGELIGLIYDACGEAGVVVEKISVLQQEVEGEQENERFSLECRTASKRDLYNAMKAIRGMGGVKSVSLQMRHRLHLKEG